MGTLLFEKVILGHILDLLLVETEQWLLGTWHLGQWLTSSQVRQGT